MTNQTKPTVSYWHLWADQDGVSHQKQCRMTEFELGSMGGADPQWKGHKTTGTMTTMVTVMPAGWVGEWHENPKPQWIIPLSGRWSSRWTEPRWNSGQAKYHSAPTRTAKRRPAEKVIDPPRSAMCQSC